MRAQNLKRIGSALANEAAGSTMLQFKMIRVPVENEKLAAIRLFESVGPEQDQDTMAVAFIT